MNIQRDTNFTTLCTHIDQTTHNVTIRLDGDERIRSLWQRFAIWIGLKPDPSKEAVLRTVRPILLEGIRQKLPHLSDEQANKTLVRLMRLEHISEHQLDQTNALKRIVTAIDSLALAGGALQFDPGVYQSGQDAENFLKFVFGEQPMELALASIPLLKALAITKNPLLLETVRNGIQDYLKRLHQHLEQDPINDHDARMGELLIGNILALYPFFEPNEGDQLAIPQKIDGAWKLVNYTVNLLQMTPSWKGDPYYACGFVPPEDEPKAAPHLSFMGTPPPTTRGSLHAEWTDFVPGLSVGETVYAEGRQVIEAWIDQQTSKGTRVNLYGQSLGGSLCLITLAHVDPEKIHEIFAYNPPSLWPSLQRKYEQNIQNRADEDLPSVNIFCQENDPIYSLGVGWDTRWNVYDVLAEGRYSPYEAHIRAFTGHTFTVLRKKSADEILSHNASVARKIYNLAAEVLRVPFFALKTAALLLQVASCFVERVWKQRMTVSTP